MPLLQSLNELIFPERCIACGVLGASICLQCRKSWNPGRYLTYINHGDHPSIKVISSITYSPVAQKIILAAKESQVRAADLLVSAALSNSIQNVLKEECIDLLIPIPSRTSAVRRRGRQFIEAMVREGSHGLSIPIYDLLKHARKVRDQSGLHLQARWNNLEGALVADIQEPLPGRALLIDDLVTTGATLNEAARALRYAGIEVAGAVTAAVALTSKIHQVL